MKHNSLNVLVVDDEWIIRQQLSRALTSVGITCDCAVDGDDALHKIAGHRYELVITDLRMPERHGHSLAVALLSNPTRPKIVALTGVTEPRLAKDLLDRGVDEVVYKPVNYFDLADRLKQLLETSASTAADNSASLPSPEDLLLNDEPLANDDAIHKSRDRLEAKLLKSSPENTWITTALRSIDWHSFPNPPVELTDFLRRLSRPAPYGFTDRRKSGRIKYNEVAIAIPLSAQFEPLGEPHKLIIRDVSRHGIGLVHSKQVDGCYLAVMWRTRKKERVIVLAHVLRCQRLDGFYDIGGELI
ncbi:MAG TPA: response regulator [Lacipirellulaceae bacterium]|nr:response regulator [Lacipirellulaceae bacterium]